MDGTGPATVRGRGSVHDHSGASVHPADPGAHRTGTAGVLHTGESDGGAVRGFRHIGRPGQSCRLMADSVARPATGPCGLLGHRGHGTDRP